MSLEKFGNPQILEFFNLLNYKNMIYVLLALDEIKQGSFSDIERCITKHRLYVPSASLQQTLKVAKREGLIVSKKYRLTEIGELCIEKIKKVLAVLP